MKDITNTQNQMSGDVHKLCTELVNAMETGFYKELNRSFKYSAFRLALKLFRNANPKTFIHIKSVIRNDIYIALSTAPGMDINIFTQGNHLSPEGRKLANKAFNIGIYVLKKKLSLMKAFKLINNPDFRNEIYNFVLRAMRIAAEHILHEKQGISLK